MFCYRTLQGGCRKDLDQVALGGGRGQPRGLELLVSRKPHLKPGRKKHLKPGVLPLAIGTNAHLMRSWFTLNQLTFVLKRLSVHCRPREDERSFVFLLRLSNYVNFTHNSFSKDFEQFPFIKCPNNDCLSGIFPQPNQVCWCLIKLFL